MLGRWADGTNESSTKHLMFQVLFFFMISCRILCKNTFNLFVYFLKKNTEIKVKSFECPKSIKIILWTSDALSTIRLSNRPSEPAWIYLRLTDFKWYKNGILYFSQFRGHSQTTFTRFGFFWPPTPLRLHFLWHKSLQKVDFFDHLPPSSCKRSLWTPPYLFRRLWHLGFINQFSKK